MVYPPQNYVKDSLRNLKRLKDQTQEYKDEITKLKEENQNALDSFIDTVRAEWMKR